MRPSDSRSDETSAGGTSPSMRDLGGKVKDDLAELREAADRRRAELLEQARQLMDQHPFLAVGAACGIGYVLSGALFSRLTGRLVLTGARMYLGRMLKDTLGAELFGVMTGAQESPAEARAAEQGA